MASSAETNPEKKRSAPESFVYHVAWLAGTLALLAVGVDAAHDILTRRG